MASPVLVVVDVQERLFNAMDPERRDEMVRNVKTLATTAHRLALPVMLTEQYPKGLGRTLPEVRAVLADVAGIEKMSFSCCGENEFLDRLKATGADEVVLIGLEAHVCVLLTALDLVRAGYRATIVADAVCSRSRANHELALEEARQAGVVVSTTETVVFRLLRRADTDVFREISKLLR